MPYRSTLVQGTLFLLRWQEICPEDIGSSCAQVKAAAAKAGRPILSLWVAPEHLPTPSGEVRGQMVDQMKVLFQHTEVHHVIEGTSLRTRLLRGFMTNLFVLSGYSGRMFVYRNVVEALIAMMPRLHRAGVTLVEAQRAAASARIFTDREDP